MGAGQAVRALRCVVFAVATTVLAALAHAVSGMQLPPADVLLVTGGALAVAVHPLTRRERELPAVLGATLAGQLVLHVVLTVAMASSCAVAPDAGGTSPATSGSFAMSGMSGAGGVSGVGCSPGGWLPMTAPGRSGPVMLAGHLLGAMLLAWWLRRGERALGRLAVLVGRALGPAVRRLAAARSVIDPPAGRTVAVAMPSGPPGLERCHPGLRGAQVWARRGPPVVAA